MRSNRSAHAQRDPQRRTFRQWRRSRPFWGGALVIAAGVELVLIPLAPMPLVVHQGIAGISSYLIGFLLPAVGILSMVQPAQRMFYGIVAVLLALGSFITSNFGGFGLGMFLALIGGSLMFAWTPRTQQPGPGAADAGGKGSGSEGEESEPPPDGGGGSPAAHALVAIPLALALGLPLAVPNAAQPAASLMGAAAPSGWDWPWEEDEPEPSLIPPDEDTPSPSPSPSKTTEEGSGGGSEEDPPGAETAEPGGQDGSEEGSEDGKEDDEQDKKVSEECAQAMEGGSGSAASKAGFLDALKACQEAAEAGELPDLEPEDGGEAPFTPTAADSGLAADSLTMYGPSFEGAVTYQTADGPTCYLKFAMDKAVMKNAVQWGDGGGAKASMEIPELVLSGERVTLHSKRMRGKLFGILPVDFSCDFYLPYLPPIPIVLTDVKAEQPIAQAGKADISDLDLSVSSPSE